MLKSHTLTRVSGFWVYICIYMAYTRSTMQIQRQIMRLESELIKLKIAGLDKKWWPLVGKINKLKAELTRANWNDFLAR